MDTNGKPKDGCENRKSPCDGKVLCHKMADCVDLESIKNDHESDDSKPMKGRMDMDHEEPLELDALGYKCKCRGNLEGNGIGPQDRV